MNLPPGFERAISILHDRLKTLPHPWTLTATERIRSHFGAFEIDGVKKEGMNREGAIKKR